VAEIAGNLISVYFEQRQQRHKLEAETAASYGQPKKPLTPRPTRSLPLFQQLVPATLQRTGPLQCPSDNIPADYCTASLAGFCSGVDILCVRWYLQIKLNLRNLVEMMAERGPAVAHATVMRWVQRYAPEFEERGARFTRSVGRSSTAVLSDHQRSARLAFAFAGNSSNWGRADVQGGAAVAQLGTRCVVREVAAEDTGER
jgi:hypothetical protein